VKTAVEALADPRVRYIRRERNGGPAATRNTGIEAATGEYVAFQDSDDEWLLDKLAMQVGVLQQYPETALCLGEVLRLIDGSLLVFSLASKTPSLAQIASLQQGYTQALVAKRQVLQAMGGFDGHLWIWEDWELLLRIAEKYPVRSVANSLVITERGNDSVTRSKDRFIQSAHYIIEKHERIFSSLPVEWSHFYYTLAHRLVEASGPAVAAGMFFKACRVNPRNWRAWVYLLLCLMRAKGLVQRLRGSLVALKNG
jgi:glycosyltransferase involved in cell wall biosynthesis